MKGGEGADLDEVTGGPRSQHLSDRLTGAAQRPGQVGVENGVPVVLRHAEKRVVAGDAGIVDEQRDPGALGEVGGDTVAIGDIEDVSSRCIDAVFPGGELVGDGACQFALASGDHGVSRFVHGRMWQI